MDCNDFTVITRLQYDYAFGIDTRDFALLRSVFTDDITMDFADYSGRPSAKLKADDWVSGCSTLFNGLDATQHVMSNPVVDVNGNTATCRMYMKAEHFLENDQSASSFTIGGYYIDKLEKQNGTWLINAVTLKLFWQRGNREIMNLAVASKTD